MEVLIAALVIFVAVDLIFTSVMHFPQRETSAATSPWNNLKEGCDYVCVLAADSP